MLDYIGSAIWEALKSLGSWIWSWFVEFFTWIQTEVIGLINQKMSALSYNIGGQWGVDFWNNMNFFFPVNEGIALLTLLCSVWVGFLLVKIILKCIPTVY